MPAANLDTSLEAAKKKLDFLEEATNRLTNMGMNKVGAFMYARELMGDPMDLDKMELVFQHDPN